MLVVFYTVITISLIGLLSYYLIFISLNRKVTACKKAEEIDGISLIICAKNEYENLKEYLPLFLQQEYKNYELIVVNDHSTDRTQDLLKSLASKHDKLRIVNLNSKDKILKGKRHALLEGIKTAKYAIIVLSDADCKPLSKLWLQHIDSAFSTNVDVVLAYSPYQRRKGLLNLIIQYETTLTALMYLSFAKIGNPYMGVGRNIAYKKSVLTENIFQASNKALSGDDDLILSEIANASNCAVLTTKDSFVESKSPDSWRVWINQKTRHYSTAKHYKIKNIFLVGAFNMLNIAFYAAICGLILTKTEPFLIILLYLFKIALFTSLNFKILKRMNARILFSVWIIDSIYFLLLLFLHIKTLFSKDQWQEAKI